MRPVHWNSLQFRLIALASLSVAIALTTACLGFLWTDLNTLHEAKRRQLQAQAEIVGFNSAAVLLIGDAQAGQQLLAPLAHQPTIDAAALYSEDGTLLASFTAAGAQPVPLAAPPAVGHSVSAEGGLGYVQDVAEGGQRVGKLYLRANMQDLWQQTWEHLIVTLVVVVASLAAALPLAFWLARATSRPILDLARTAHRITEQGDFSVRVKSKLRNEIGALYRAFNEMLQHVDASDRALKASQDELEQRVELRTAELKREIEQRERVQQDLIVAKDAAEAASRAKSEFLANMSHEIRTPMNGVLGLTELVLDTELSRDQRESMEMVKSSAEALMVVINDILDFSKIEAGKLELDPVEFELPDLLEDTVKTLALRAHGKGLELGCEIAADVPPRVIGDPGRLRQVLVNLIGNAIKFTEQGEVVVAVERGSGELVNGECASVGRGDLPLTAHNSPTHLRFAIRDTGIGIPPEKQRVIFEAFSQADGSMTRKYGGTGLGLTISSQLVALMGGALRVESVLGQGSTFHFAVPLAESISPRTTSVRAASVSLAGLAVLAVDDNATNLRILEGLLRQWGARPTCASSGLAALAELQRAAEAEAPYSLLLVDAMMPEMDGFMLIERVRQQTQGDPPTVMMLTSADGIGDASRCRELGIEAYLIKPVRSSELHRSIAAVMQRDRLPQKSAARPAEDRSRPKPAPLDASLSSAKILLAEDNPVNQRVAQRILSKHGHCVIVANNGREALEALERERFDVVLMDVQMPELDGFEATRAIRLEETVKGGHLPIIAMTAHAMKGDRERCLEAGMDDYVTKPFETPQLLAVIERARQGQLAPADSANLPVAPTEADQLACATERL